MRSLKADTADRVLKDSKKPARRKASGKRSTERTLPRRNRRRRTVLFAALGLALIAIGTGVFGYTQNWHGQAAAALDRGVNATWRGVGLAVGEVTVEGRRRTGPDALRRALDVEIGAPILRLDLNGMRERIEDIGWVRSASITRQLPDRLHVRIEERVPYARWQLNGRTALIDRNGEVILKDVGSRYSGLPRIVGPDANRRAAALFDMLEASPRLATLVRSASLIRERRWDIGMANGVTIRLPEESPDEAWTRFNEVDQRDGLLAQRLKLIDLRVPGRVIVRLKPKSGDPETKSERET